MNEVIIKFRLTGLKLVYAVSFTLGAIFMCFIVVEWIDSKTVLDKDILFLAIMMLLSVLPVWFGRKHLHTIKISEDYLELEQTTKTSKYAWIDIGKISYMDNSTGPVYLWITVKKESDDKRLFFIFYNDIHDVYNEISKLDIFLSNIKEKALVKRILSWR